MRISPDTTPVHIARAYGLNTGPAASPSLEHRALAPDIAHRDDVVDLQNQSRAESATELIAAQVNKPVDFAQPKTGAAASSAIPFYRHPADRNAAATSIEAGRVIDVSG